MLLLGAVGCLGFVATHQDQPPAPPVTEAVRIPAPPAPSARPALGPKPAPLPVSIAIPALRVRSPLLHLGLARDGSLEVPTGPVYDRAAWYRGSPAPGATGPAVLLGHVDSAKGGPSVFFRLGGLRTGDRVMVTRADRSTVVFVVDSVARYPKSEFPTALVYGNTTSPALRLITCGGTFDRRTGHYKDNIVVLASLVAGPRVEPHRSV